MKYVSLIRGINVGGRTIKMAELKNCLENLGFQELKTIAHTGNIIFESTESSQSLKQSIEKQLTKTFSYPARVQIISLIDLKKIVQNYPFISNDHTRHNYVIFFENGLARQAFLDFGMANKKIEEINLGKTVIYWRVLKGITLTSPFARHLAKLKYNQLQTTRNLNTLQKIILE